ncbi:MAG TPA: cytochrome P450 [Ktedonobacteraceae bacterium]
MFAFQRTPLQFLTHMTRTYGDVSQFRLLNLPLIVLNHPDDLQRVMQKNHMNYDKDVHLFKASQTVFGNGLVTHPGGEEWLRHRRLMQPAFHHQRINAMGSLMTSAALKMLEDWQPAIKAQKPINMDEEMMRLTLQITSKALFSLDIADTSNPFGQACDVVNTTLTNFIRFPLIPLSWPTPQHLRYRRAIENMDKICYALIRQRQAKNEDTGDLLSMMMQTRDEETGTGMSEQELRDEVITLLFAGQETSAESLAWTMYLLSQYPEIEARFHDELDRVLNGRVPTIEDLAHLPYTRMVLEESVRIYPPSWEIMRHTIADDELGGYHIPAGSLLFWTQYTVHRHPDFWENPEEFNPERFLPEAVAKRHSYAYIPFSNGPRVCIGNTFSLVETQLVLATFGQRYRFRMPPSAPPVKPVALLTLHPSYSMMLLEPRN